MKVLITGAAGFVASSLIDFFGKNDKNISLTGIDDFSYGYKERIKDLDEIPSPYLNGMMDKFFDGKLTPFLETNRGCPFTCSFCHTGSDYFHKLKLKVSIVTKSKIFFI